MNAEQIAKYFREWGAVRKACLAANLPIPDRHELHRRALGYDKSSKEFTNEEFTKVLQEFWAISKPANLGAQLRQVRMPTTVLRHRIMNEQVSEVEVLNEWSTEQAVGYVIGIMTNRFGTDDLMQISDKPVPRGKSGWVKSDLELLRDTLAARINEMRRKKSWTIHQMKTAAGLKCPCAACRKAELAQQTETEPTSEEVMQAWSEEH